MQQTIIYLNNWFLVFYFFMKIRALETYPPPLKMNLVPEI
jgi:hypothetical protein